MARKEAGGLKHFYTPPMSSQPQTACLRSQKKAAEWFQYTSQVAPTVRVPELDCVQVAFFFSPLHEPVKMD